MINRAINETVKSIREKNLARSKSKEDAGVWKEKDLHEGEVVDAGVVILPTKGCAWGRKSGCTMCGYVYDSSSLDDKHLFGLFKKALLDLGGVSYLKIFNSGSFFDRNELSDQLVQSIAETINRSDIQMVQVESRPEFLKKDVLKKFKGDLNPELEVGIGLETSNDHIRMNCINKGFSFEDYRRAVRLCNSLGVWVKTYLLLKPPFILEREAIADTVKSAADAAGAGSQKISINPVNVQRGTLVELLWRRGEYRSPWIWSLLEVLKQVSNSGLNIPIIAHPTGAGGKRGIHNCGKCDSSLIEAVRAFSLNQDQSLFEGLDCQCRGHWWDYLLLE
jgi:radical SAM enzyme (TIGR01210 family)